MSCRQRGTQLGNGRWDTRFVVRSRRDDGVETVIVKGRLSPPEAKEDLVEEGALSIPALGLVLLCSTPSSLDTATGPSLQVPALPALAELLDPPRAARLIEAAVRGADPHHESAVVASCEPEVMRYQPGSRCTTRYRVHYAEPTTAPELVVSKTHRGDEGLVAWNGMCALWATDLAAGDVVAIAQPLSYDPSTKVLFQGPVRGEVTLKAMVREALRTNDPAAIDHVGTILERTADGLAALHGCGATAAETATFELELAEVTDAWGRLVAVVPALEGSADALFDLVLDLAGGSRADPVVPSHRSFRPAQVLVDGDRIGFIDFDGFCLAEPALDVSLMRATLRCFGAAQPATGVGDRERELGARLDVLDRWCDAFLQRYRSRADATPERVLAWELLDVFVNLQNAWTKAIPARPAVTLPVLARLLSQL